MVSHMKTTIHIPDSLFNEAKKVAQQEKTTLKALVEEGLRKALNERRGRKPPRFKLRKASFKGQGLQPHLEDVTWDQILDISYKGRGG
ncbi:MAG: type II toxin-antitoxin system VapB family antitoxin [Candidatus Aminicenantes bacterium]|nr:type II toxin-antitoxin system VapB family antitoxin [Candidatus Aminicenantes bacterium]